MVYSGKSFRCRKDQSFSAKVWDFVTAFVNSLSILYERLDVA